jgi:hypothetical protein
MGPGFAPTPPVKRVSIDGRGGSIALALALKLSHNRLSLPYPSLSLSLYIYIYITVSRYQTVCVSLHAIIFPLKVSLTLFSLFETASIIVFLS